MNNWLQGLVKRTVVGVIILIMAIATTGCDLESFKKSSISTSRIVTSTISDPKTFNPVTNDVSTIIFGLMYASLIAEDGTDGTLKAALAEKWQISEDQKEIIFTLRPGLKWSDGEPFTVDDIVFTYNDVLFNPKIPSGVRDILRIGEQGLFPSVTKVGDRQVKFTVPEPFAPFLRYAGGISILPKHVLESSVNTLDADGQPKFLSTWGTDTDPAELIGNGPYRLVTYVPGQRLIFERNPHYWKNDLNPDAEPQPYIEQLVQQIVESIDSSLLQFRSGGIDVMGLTPEQFSLLKRETKKGNFTIYNDDPRPSTSFITFNLNTGKRDGKPLVDPVKSRWFNTLAFRQAVAYSIDRQTMINNLYQGLGEPQNSPIAVQSIYYLKDGLKQYDYDPNQAKELLLGAGFTYNAEKQLIDAEGNLVRFTLMTNSGNNLREKMGAQIKRDLAQVGIQVDFQPIAFNTLVERAANTLDWDCILLGFGGSTEPNGGSNVWKTDGNLHMFNQDVVTGETPLTDRTVSDWEIAIEQLYTRGAQELDDTKRKAVYAESQKLIQENLPFIYLVNPLSLIAIRNRIEGVQYTARYSSSLTGALWNIEELTLSAE